MKRQGPYEIEVKPFKGDTYKLELLGGGMDIVDFKHLEDRLALAKTNR